MAEKKKVIDVKKVIQDKSPNFFKFLPGFVIKYLQKILHEDDVNEFIHEHKNDTPIEFCLSVMTKFNIDVQVEGLENIPKDGGAVLASNHPLGGMDAMALVTVLHDKRPDIKFIVNDVLMHLENLRPIFVGVDVVNGRATSALRKVDEAFAGDELLCIFPAGLVSRKIKGEVMDLEWKKTFVTRSIKHEKTIIPVYIDGKLTNFFYNLYRFRKTIGIKANIEMLYLVNELYKQHDEKIKITFGKAIPANELNGTENHSELAQNIKDKVYQLR